MFLKKGAIFLAVAPMVAFIAGGKRVLAQEAGSEEENFWRSQIGDEADDVGRSQVPPAAVGYQDHPSGDHSCDNCKFFQKPNGCQLVSGKIDGNAWCKLWQKHA
jgi:hypothetical protein